MYTTGIVTSSDGTIIGYRRLGDGPAVLLLHGGVNSAKHMMKLGLALKDAFTVFLPDRRGRGTSGPIGPDYRIEREDEDLAALVNATGAEFVFGPADGGLFALHGAIHVDRISKVAAYEPLLFMGQPGTAEIRQVFTTMQEHIRAGRIGEAVMFSVHETVGTAARTGQLPGWLAAAVHRIPVHATGELLDRLLKLERPRTDSVPMRELLIALVPELDVVMATEGTLEEYRELKAEALLLYGGLSDPIFAESANALHGVLPRSTVVRLPGLNHDSAQTYGKPDTIAAALRVFFSSASI
jgi:pimeloyl-ACP methyl ester carboxylesterase